MTMVPLLELARDADDGEVEIEEHERGKRELLHRMREPQKVPRAAWLKAAASMAAAAIVFVCAQWFWKEAATLPYTIESGSVIGEGFVVPVVDRETKLRFNDGSTITLAARSTVRIVEVEDDRARLILESGSMHLAINPANGRRWSVHAGAYEVRITGTELDIRRHGDTIVVEMTNGSVLLIGPMAKRGVEVSGRQRALVTPYELRIETAPVVHGTSVTSSSTTASAPPAGTTRALSAVKTPTWASLVTAGKFDRLVALAEKRGIDSVLASAPSSDLSALADAARYTGRAALARRALLATRKRFSKSASAVAAAFLLGGLERSPANAIRWYERYLAEGGTSFAEAALGRKMLAERRLGRTKAARATATTYLSRHANGAHAKAARSIATP